MCLIKTIEFHKISTTLGFDFSITWRKSVCIVLHGHLALNISVWKFWLFDRWLTLRFSLVLFLEVVSDLYIVEKSNQSFLLEQLNKFVYNYKLCVEKSKTPYIFLQVNWSPNNMESETGNQSTVPKKGPNDFIFGHVLGDGSFSTVNILCLPVSSNIV